MLFEVSTLDLFCPQVVQYIGELCRFLLAQPPLPTDTQHRVRLALGNGLKPRVWEEFQRRFKVPRVGEFYGSTEGNVGLLNFEGKPGACGFLSEIVPSLYPVRIVKVDPDTGEIMRGADGRLMKCKAGEVGTPVGILDKSGEKKDVVPSGRGTTHRKRYQTLTI